ncbi:N-acetylmuramoyl-L-alanine amidase [Thiohalomonas denitrificans]|uniref:N-acetylmuramoyl-L-alanine amidase n=1 Tax=Thiohalomonas denitrificans TaxID=415747 RepID=UPI0026EBC816|nr:N-acetylmuramoyl-L-alanine amidase [Thiohalomonas denitrificans]
MTKVTGGTSFIRSYDGVTDAKTLPGQTKTSDSPEKSNDAQGSANAAGGRTPGAANGKDKNTEKTNNGKALGKDKEKNNNGKSPGKDKNTKAKTKGNFKQGSHPGQGVDNRSDRANEVAMNTCKNKHLIEEHCDEDGNGIPDSQEDGSDGGIEDGTIGDNTDGTEEEIVTLGSNGEQLFYYHPDHLGSTGYVTRENGEVHEHIQYFPFGETWVQQGGNTEKSPYLFTGKELDEETGLYYFGARYYDPRTSVWQSADPILASYLNGKPSGGVYSPSNLALFSYVGNNPLVFVDPDGMAKIMIDPGHGDHHSTNPMVDPGAVAKHGDTTYKEKDLALSFSQAVGAELTQLGHEVSYTRTGDVDDTSLKKLSWRTDMADKDNPDLFLSVHLDAAGSEKASGLSVFANKQGAKAKQEIEGAVTSTGVRKPGARNLHVLRQNRPSLLLESGFITNPADVQAVQGDGSGNVPLAKEVASGIDKALQE